MQNGTSLLNQSQQARAAGAQPRAFRVRHGRLAALVLCGLPWLGCSDDGPAQGTDLGAADMASPPDQSGQAFLPAVAYAAEIKIDPGFPFGVTRRYTTTRNLRGARWGKHGGPMTTGNITDGGMSKLAVSRFTAPAASTGALQVQDLFIATASGLPASVYYNAMVDLPFTDAAVLSYTASGAAFPGELLLYGADYAMLRNRAHTNGIYGVAGTGTGTLFYTGLSGLTATATTTQDNGLWRSDLCSGSVVPSGTCPASRKVLGWDGYSGPVVKDAQGNLFVAASLSATPPAPTDEVYALTRAETESTGTVAKTAVLSLSSAGTSSLAAVAPAGGKPGWLLQKGYDGMTGALPATAQGYVAGGQHITAQGTALTGALRAGTAATGFSMLTDDQGGLWIAVSAKDENVLLGLQPLP